MGSWKTKKLNNLCQAFLSLQNIADLQNFLRDLCTLEELEELSSRWQAAILISDGLPYREISTQTGLSTATITRIAHWLNNGEGGYKKAITLIDSK